MKRNKFVCQEPPKLDSESYSMVTLSNPLVQLLMFDYGLFEINPPIMALKLSLVNTSGNSPFQVS